MGTESSGSGGAVVFYTVLQGLGLFAVLMFSYLGANYMLKGDITSSFGLGIIIILGLSLLVSGMIRIKRKGLETGYHNGFTFLEGLALVAYAILAIAAFFLMAHFIHIEHTLKDDIKSSGNARLSDLEQMFQVYRTSVDETVENLEREMKNAVSSFDQHGQIPKLKGDLDKFNISISAGTKSAAINEADRQISTSLIASEERALTDVNEMEQQAQVVVQRNRAVYENWNRKALHSAFVETEMEIASKFAALKEKFQAPEPQEYWNAYGAFEYPRASEEQQNVVTNPLALIKAYQPSWLIPLIFFFVIHALILLPYAKEKRAGHKITLPPRRKEPKRGIKV